MDQVRTRYGGSDAVPRTPTQADMDALMDLLKDIKSAKGSGKSEAQLISAQDYQRKAQFYLDFIEAENSMGFHAPQEAARILGESIDFARKGQVTLRELK